jgi:gliding motility-associated transport system permease protein
MKQSMLIAKRELTSMFYSPIAYIVLGLFAFGTSLIFFYNFGPGQPATLRTTFDSVIWLMILLVPPISMGLISEELRSGSLEMLMTAPVSDTSVIMGKWVGAMGFLAFLLSPFVVFAVVLACVSKPEWGPIISGLVGLMLVGGLYLAIGVFASALTRNQIVALLITIFVICLLTFLMFFLPRAKFVTPGLQEACHYINVNYRFNDFSKGLIDTSNLMYFASGIALFLFLAVQVLQSRRWR